MNRYFLILLALPILGLGCSYEDPFGELTPPITGTLSVQGGAGILANGVDGAWVKVEIKDFSGNPQAGHQVALRVILGSGDFTSAEGISDDAGLFITELSSSEVGYVQISAMVEISGESSQEEWRALPQRPRVRFVNEPLETVELPESYTIAMGAEPEDVALVDLNGDSRLDLITANRSSKSLSLAKGLGNGYFELPIDLPLGAAPRHLASGDLNSDGLEDLIVTLGSSGRAAFVLGSADGLEAVVARGFDAVSYAADIEILNFSDDAGLEFLIIDPNAEQIRIFSSTNLNAPTVVEEIPISAGSDRVTVVGVADSLRLISTNSIASQVSTWQAGVASAPVDLIKPQQSLVVPGNDDEDALAIILGAERHLYLCDISLSTPCGDDSTFLAADGYILALHGADINGDSRMDLITASHDGEISILLNAAENAFSAKVSFVAGAQPSAIASGDINGDGALDIVIANRGSSTVTVIRSSPAE